MAANKKKFIQAIVDRPGFRKGALTNRAKREGRTVLAQARHDVAKGTTLEKQQGGFFLRVLRKGGKKKRKGRGSLLRTAK